MKLIVGLGNPGPEYDNHRHNLGFWVVDQLAKEGGVKFAKNDDVSAWETWVSIENEECFLFKPLTWMNHSGTAVKKILQAKQARVEDLIVVHDDIDLRLGEIRWAFAAGHGGHNGVRSIIEQVEDNAFYRLRLGIGRPPAHVDPADYVLEPFSGDDLKAAETLTARAAQSAHDFLQHGLDWVRNRYH